MLLLVLLRLHNHLSARLLPLALVRLFLAHLQHFVARRLVLERELDDHLAEHVRLHVTCWLLRVAEEEEELVESAEEILQTLKDNCCV